MSGDYQYPGEELALFEKAKHWKKYLAEQILPFIKGDVLEAGAGTGSTTRSLNNQSASSWTLLEPDEEMHAGLAKKILQGILPPNCRVLKGTLATLKPNEQFDCILYIDVLEHIADDRQEIERAAEHLRPGGRLVVLSPAYDFLFSPFDKAIGHYRRYTRRSLKKLSASSMLKAERCVYLDTAGFFASLANKLFLKQRYPTQEQVNFWDRWMIPVSKISDRIFFYCFGKSILAVWKKP